MTQLSSWKEVEILGGLSSAQMNVSKLTVERLNADYCLAVLESFFSLELLMEPVRTGLRQIMSDLLRARPAEEAVVLAWPLVCGKEVATRTQAVSFANGTLIVEVADVNWRNQLQSFVPTYLSGYEGLLGQVVKSIRLE